MSIYSPDGIEEYLQSVIKSNSLDLCFKHHFLGKGIVKKQILVMNDEDLLSSIRIMLKYDILPIIDEKTLLEQIKDDNFIWLNRINPWKLHDVDVIDSKIGKTTLGCAETKIELTNLWGFTDIGYYHTLIFNKKTMEVLWADFGNYSDLSIKNRKYKFISHNKNVFNLMYLPTNVYFFENPCMEQILSGTDSDSLDLFVKNEMKESIEDGYGFITEMFFAKNCDLKKCIDNSFFDRGPKWKYGECISCKGESSTYIKDIYSKNEKINIVIENNTFEKPECVNIIIDFDNNIVINENNNQSSIIEKFVPQI